MKIAFLHISDLHLVEYSLNQTKISSMLDVHKNYVDEFVRYLNTSCDQWGVKIKNIIITGDLANQGSKPEYEIVSQELKKLTDGLGLTVKECLVVPGNHDINWPKNDVAYNESPISPRPPHSKYYDEKFHYFKDFYIELTGNDFDPCTPQIVTFEDLKIAFVCLNSSINESSQPKDHYGFLELDYLKKIENDLLDAYKDYYKVALLHHNPYAGVVEKGIKNWNLIQAQLNSMGIHSFLSGHIHTNDNAEVITGQRNCYSAVGSFAKEGGSNSAGILIYEKEDNNSLIFTLKRFYFVPGDGMGFHGTGKWIEDTSGYNNEFKLFKTMEKIGGIIDRNPHIPEDIIPGLTDLGQVSIIKDEKQEFDYSSEILDLVRKRNAVVSGHFHWSEDTRSHGWIDTGALLSKDQDIEKIGRALFAIIREKQIEFDGIVGLGMEGNMLGSLVAAAVNKPYTYIPVLNRKEYNNYELDAQANAKKILILSDVVSTTSTIVNIITNPVYKFFEEAEKIIVVSLFFTGTEEKRNEAKMTVKKLEFYSLCEEIKFGYCNYKPDECPIVKNKLQTIHEFYTKE